MGKLSDILRSVENGGVSFWCPGCKCTHTIKVEGSPSWSWNKDVNRPTFSPSILVTSGHYVKGQNEAACWCHYYEKHPLDERLFSCMCCHSYVTEGRIEFLSDSTHELAGKTVSLPHFPGVES